MPTEAIPQTPGAPPEAGTDVGSRCAGIVSHPCRLRAPPLAEWRRILIAEIAFDRARKHGFQAGHELEDWRSSERCLDGTRDGE